MRIGLFGGSFDPVHSEHIALVKSALDDLRLDKLVVIPAGMPPHKPGVRLADGSDRIAMCRLAFSTFKNVEVSDYEIKKEGTSYTYLTVTHFKELYPDAELFWLVGTDMYYDFFTWKKPEIILSNATLAVCGRAEKKDETALRQKEFFARFHQNFTTIGYNGAPVSSTELRTRVALSLPIDGLTDPSVVNYISEKGLYKMPLLDRAFALEKADRVAHSKRVCLFAMRYAQQFHLPKDKVFLASALHDVAKYLSLDCELLKGFISPKDVPMPVLHQFTGAYVLQNSFGIDDEDVLNAVRYHTSGRAQMSDLEKLVYIADMLEDGRDFPGVQALRESLNYGLDYCMYRCLKHQMDYLKKQGGSVYPLSKDAYEYFKDIVKEKGYDL